VARVYNSYLRQPTDRLEALVNRDDGTGIDVFPATREAIGQMTSKYFNPMQMTLKLTIFPDGEIETVLGALGAPGQVRNNNRPAKTSQLCIRIGINPHPQYR
jgi:hypothetical protein